MPALALLLALLLATASAATAPLRLDAALYLPMDAPPSAGVSADGTLRAGIAASTPVPASAAAPPGFGGAWDFAGTSECIHVHGAPVALSGLARWSSGFTVALWVRLAWDRSEHANTRLLGFGQFELVAQGGADAGQITVNGLGVAAAVAGALDGAWHHVVVSAAFLPGTVDIYLDGELQSSAAHEDGRIPSFSNDRSDKFLYVGCRLGGNNQYKGQLDELTFFHRALGASEVALLLDPATAADPVPVVQAHSSETLVTDVPRVTLAGSVDPLPVGAQVRWVQVEGPGEAVFDAPDAPLTAVTLPAAPEGETYRAFRFRLEVSTATAFAQDAVTVVHTTDARPARTLSGTPAPFQHPRVLFSATDLPALLEQLESSEYAQRGAAYMTQLAETTLLGEPIYEQLVDGDYPDDPITPDDYAVYCEALASVSYLALVRGERAQLAEYGAALATLSEVYHESYEPDFASYLLADTNMECALAYDFAYGEMTEAGRAATRALLSAMSQYRYTPGSYRDCWDVGGNWDLFHDHLVMVALAIEGEPGYDEAVLSAQIQKTRDFFSCGVAPDGYPKEGAGYYFFGLERGALALVAAARRDENLFATAPSLHQSALVAMAEIQPWRGGNMMSHHDGQAWGNGFFLSTGYHVFKWMFPDDPAVDYLYRAHLDYFGEDRKMRLSALVFSLPTIPGNADPEVAAQASALPLTFFGRERGIVNTRSGWDSNATRVDFECRMDVYRPGHMHSDRNMFTLSALGRTWVTDNGYHSVNNDEHATVLIDGKGQGGSSADPRWPSFPGRFLWFHDSALYTAMAGDAKTAYDFSPAAGESDATAPFPFTSADFVYPPGRDTPAWMDRPLSTDGSAFVYNPVARALRSVALVRGDAPFVVVADDIQKDDADHTYSWVFNTPHVVRGGGNDQDHYVVEHANETDLVLRHPDDAAPGTPRLLVRALRADGAAHPWALETRAIGTYSPDVGAPRDVVFLDRGGVVAPNFRILLFPYVDGHPLPSTTWTDDATVQVEVPGGGGSFVVHFAADRDGGPTLIEVEREDSGGDEDDGDGSGSGPGGGGVDVAVIASAAAAGAAVVLAGGAAAVVWRRRREGPGKEGVIDMKLL